MSKLRIPHIIGMVLAGVAVGPYGFGLLAHDASFELFGRVGLLYIMFLAGLEMDLVGLRRAARHTAVFAALTFLVPGVITFFAARWLLGYGMLRTLLLCCIMAANTLVAYPIVARYGLSRHRTVTISVGASMVALLVALVAVAAIVGSTDGSASHWTFWPLFVAKLTLYTLALTWVIPRLTRLFLRRYSDAVMQFVFVLAVMFTSAAACEMIGLEGILGAFLSGLILGPFIPAASPLMNRIEFTGNALFIPYFLIGVGMLINVRLLWEADGILPVVACIVVFGTLGKALAAYAAAIAFHLPWRAGHMMFGLTSAHAAGAIAFCMVGMRLMTLDGTAPLVDDTMMNGVVIMVLATCVISTLTTEHACRATVLAEQERGTHTADDDDEKILIPVKYHETCDTLVHLAVMTRNARLGRGLVALNVVYDDPQAEANQQRGAEVLRHVARTAAAADVRLQTQVRLATNIGNGIKHAFREFDCSEVIMGLHIHQNSTRAFWGDFAQSVYNGLSRQITICRCAQPWSTLTALHIAVPSRAEYEPGFYRWLTRLCRLGQQLTCTLHFHGRRETLDIIEPYIDHNYRTLRCVFVSMPKWIGLPALAAAVKANEMLVVVTARAGTVSYKAALERLPDELRDNFTGHNLMIIFPDQYGPAPEQMTFAGAAHREQLSAYQEVLRYIALWRAKRRRRTYN